MQFEQENPQSDVIEQPESSQPDTGSPQESSTAEAPKPDNVPFHEHPRFKELVEEKNRYRQELDAYRAQLEETKSKISQFEAAKPAPVDPMMEKLKGIDPEFASFIDGIKSQAAKAEALEKTLNEMKEQTFVQTAVSNLENLYQKDKVSPELREIYNEQLNSLYSRGAIRSIEDLNKAYAQVHSRYSKLFEDVRRTERESYVSSKSKDTKAPTPMPKGQVQAPGAQKFSNDPNERKAQAVQQVLQHLRAERSI